MILTKRNALFAGSWYPTSKKAIGAYLTSTTKKTNVIAAMVPHAGWIYSGKVAGSVFSAMSPADTYIIISPNHTGIGPQVSIYPSGSWQTPIGSLSVNAEFVSHLCNEYKSITPDTTAHSQEHSIEVQLPFIKYINPSAKIVPITLANYSLELCTKLALSIAKIIKEKYANQKVLILASSDMSHYISVQQAKTLDTLAINDMLSLNAAALLKTVEENNISMCGSGPVAVAITAAKALGAKEAKLIAYDNSGTVTNSTSEVVSYAGMLFL
ncbi:MAG: AmmeMemoRadiSam system protein B [Endomicrobiales bacterium]|nr:AmmeMemoRadiSam system protein B [Endomicrobiales bacterium]